MPDPLTVALGLSGANERNQNAAQRSTQYKQAHEQYSLLNGDSM